MNIILPTTPPFSLSSVIRSHGWHQLKPFQTNDDFSTLSYIYQLDGGKVIRLEMSQVEQDVLISINAPLTSAEQTDVQKKVHWMLALEQDLSLFYELADKEPKLQHMRPRAQGRVLRSPTLFEDVVKTILTTNTVWASTKRMVANLVEQFGDPFPSDPDQRAFPTPARLTSTSESVLRQQTRLGYRAPYILELAQRVTNGELDLEAYKTSPISTPELRKQLLALKGIGAYAAANLLMILGRYDYLPLDTWALKMVSHEWYQGEPVTPNQVEAAFERWGQWKGLAYWFWDWDYHG